MVNFEYITSYEHFAKKLSAVKYISSLFGEKNKSVVQGKVVCIKLRVIHFWPFILVILNLTLNWRNGACLYWNKNYSLIMQNVWWGNYTPKNYSCHPQLCWRCSSALSPQYCLYYLDTFPLDVGLSWCSNNLQKVYFCDKETKL